MPDLQAVQDAQATGVLQYLTAIATGIGGGIVAALLNSVSQNKKIEAAANSAPPHVEESIREIKQEIKTMKSEEKLCEQGIRAELTALKVQVTGTSEKQAAEMHAIRQSVERLEKQGDKIVELVQGYFMRMSGGKRDE
jgi:esterase/lipase